MRQRFKARELWLFLPIVLVGALAWYWGRVEQASGPNGRGMYVSDFKVEAAPGYFQEKGYSNRVVVTISHFWPRPKWWGGDFQRRIDLDPLHPEEQGAGAFGLKREQTLASGGALTIERDGKIVAWPAKSRAMNAWPKFDGTNYVFSYYVRRDELSKEPQAVTFRGLYRIGPSPLLPLTRAFRKAGQTLPVPPDKNPGARLVSVDAMPFLAMPTRNSKGLLTTEITSFVFFILRPTEPTLNSNGVPDVRFYDLQVRDESGKIYLDQKPVGFGLGFGGPLDRDKAQLKPDEILNITSVHIDTAIPISGRLTLRGKVSLDEHWPVVFKVQLPPRASAIPPNVEWPHWTRPTPATPIR